MNREEKRYLKSKMNEYAKRYFNRNKIDERFAAAYEIKKAFKSAFMFSYKLFMNHDNFWEPRYWILNDIYVKAMKADAEYLAKLKNENEELKAQIEKMKCCWICENRGLSAHEEPCLHCKRCFASEDVTDQENVKDNWKLLGEEYL